MADSALSTEPAVTVSTPAVASNADAPVVAPNAEARPDAASPLYAAATTPAQSSGRLGVLLDDVTIEPSSNNESKTYELQRVGPRSVWASWTEGVGWSTAIAWFFIFLFFAAIVALVVWWILSITLPRRACDREVRDLHARDVCAGGNVVVGGNLAVGGVTTDAAAFVRALSLPPVQEADAVVTLDGTNTSIMLTNPSTTAAAAATLPPAADNAGLMLAIFNETGFATFTVTPAGSDTIEGVAGPTTQNSLAVFLAMGTPPNRPPNWKRIAAA